MSNEVQSRILESIGESNAGTGTDTQNATDMPPPAESSKKRKAMEPRSEVWAHFVKYVNEKGEIKGKCNYCQKDISCHPKMHGTTGLNSHIKKCKKYFPNVDNSQAHLNYQPAEKGQEGAGGSGTLTNWKFNQETARSELAYMVIVDELPFKYVENKGFKRFMSRTCPLFRIPSRLTVTRDCYQLYLNERLKLKQFLKKSCERVCLTTDTWTSLQKINYMCLTAHFIDNDWKLNKKILNFCPISSHKGEAIGKAIEMCLLEWGIERVMTITVDNASSNDTAINYLRGKFSNWGSNVLNGKFLHMRCVAHIINLVVVDGLKEVGESVARVRAAVKFVRQSPARLKKFKECVEVEKIQSKSLLCLDVSTRWNSTYLMLDAALKFQRAFERFDDQEPFYSIELEPTTEDIINGKVRGKGKPRYSDWENVKRMVQFLEHFYHLTLRVSGSLYCTLNTYFHEIIDVQGVLKEWLSSDDLELHLMATKMKEKYDKYWGDDKKTNLLIHVAVVLDPRYKLVFIKFAVNQVYEEDVCVDMSKKVRDAVYELFDEYKVMYAPQSGQSSSSERQESSSGVVSQQNRKVTRLVVKDLFKKHMTDSGSGDNKSELDRYLSEDIEDDSDGFDILEWWKVNSVRFPILSHLARQVLAVPISTVASESAFSTGGRVLDAFRSSLTPKIVQALICTQDWFRSSSLPLNVEEDLAELEKLETYLSTSIAIDS